MLEVGIRELKSRLSYYVQLAQAGETIAVKVRNRIVSFLSDKRPPEKALPRTHSKRRLERIMEQWKREGILLSGGICRHRPFKPVKMTPGPTTTELIRQMRDED